jgi:hypothetical protein
MLATLGKLRTELRGFYRTGHYTGLRRRFFGFVSRANYGPNLDIYNGETSGFEVDGKRALKGFKAAGPNYGGSNQLMQLKSMRPRLVSLILQCTMDADAAAVSSIAVPLPRTGSYTLK